MDLTAHLKQHFDEGIELRRQMAESMPAAIARAGTALAEALRGGRKVLACGNGGSAADSQHFAAEIVGRFERKGLRIVAMKHMTVPREMGKDHYAEHEDKPFFGDLVDFITGGPLVALVLEGHEAVTAARQVIGATNPLEAAPGSIRGDLAIEVTFNLVHGSDSDESAQREIELWFPEL